MARPTHWQRGVVELADEGTAANYHAAPLDVYTDGSTIERVRFRYQCQHVPDFAAEGVGLSVAVGLALLDELTSPDTALFPAQNPSASNWLWWEASFFQPKYVADSSGLYEIDLLPGDDIYRDCRAMRKVVGSQTLWLVSETSTLAETQTDHYLSVSYSTLVIEPA